MKSLVTYCLIISACFVVASCSCERLDEAKNVINNVKNIKEAAENMQENMEEAEKRLEDRKERGDTMAIHYETLAEYLPQSFDGYDKVGDMQGGTTKTPGMGSYSNVSQDYENGEGDRLSISIVDYNAAYGLYTTIMAAYVSGFEIDNTDEHIKGFEISDDVKGWTVHRKKDHTVEVYTGVSDRFHITVEADNQKDIDFAMDISTKEIAIDDLSKL